jgi:predicted small lipoprotein YifL
LVILLWLMPSLLAVALAGCGHAGGLTLPWDRPAPPAGITLTDLQDVGDLETVFNQDAGKPRLIMLVSPT